MKKGFLAIALLALLFAGFADGCTSSRSRRRIPKKGPIPCPVKDC
ncbi:MAG: hypothetical protein V4543_04025 [Bacteroidota bacterium]